MGLFVNDPFEFGSWTAMLTHGHPSGYMAAGAFALLLDRLRQGTDMDAALDEVETRIPGRGPSARHNHGDQADPTHETLLAVRAARELAAKGSPSAEKVESLGQGWVAEEALAIALYCALVTDDFESGVLLAVNHGGDSDSTGAIAGNLLGLMYGLEAIPTRWLDELELHDVIEQVAHDLARHTGVRGARGRSPDYERYPPW